MGNRRAAGQLLRRKAHVHGNHEKGIRNGEESDSPEHALSDKPVVCRLLRQRGHPLVPDKKKNTDSCRLNNVLQRKFGTMHGDAHVYIMRGECIRETPIMKATMVYVMISWKNPVIMTPLIFITETNKTKKSIHRNLS